MRAAIEHHIGTSTYRNGSHQTPASVRGPYSQWVFVGPFTNNAQPMRGVASSHSVYLLALNAFVCCQLWLNVHVCCVCSTYVCLPLAKVSASTLARSLRASCGDKWMRFGYTHVERSRRGGCSTAVDDVLPSSPPCSKLE